MKIEEVQELKDGLELDITELVQTFIKSTGLEIRAISLDYQTARSHKGVELVAQVEVCFPHHI